MLACLGRKEQAGRPTKVLDGIAESVAIRTLLYKEKEKTFEQVAKDHQIPLARSTVEKIAYEHTDPEHPCAIVRGVKQIKPFLTPDNMEWRVEYCEWALKKLKEGAIFIFSDEDYHNFGGASHKKQRITRMEGEPAELHAEHQKTSQFSFMHWGAICMDTDIKAPMSTLDVETTLEKKASEDKLETENVELRNKIGEKRKRALEPGTKEHRELTKINQNIQRLNDEPKQQEHTGRKGFKRTKKPEQIWKYEELSQSNKKNGVDWYAYREKVLVPLLYPYYEQVKAKYPDREVWLIEDNAGGHSRASLVMEEDRKSRGILKAPHPPNSPDLNMIEGLWDYLKDRLDEYPINGSSQSEVDLAKNYIRREWDRCGAKIKHQCSSFEDRLHTCIKFHGDNNWRG